MGGTLGFGSSPALPAAPWTGSEGVGARTCVGCGEGERLGVCLGERASAVETSGPGVGLVGISERSRVPLGEDTGSSASIPNISIPEPLGCIPAEPGAPGGRGGGFAAP